MSELERGEKLTTSDIAAATQTAAFPPEEESSDSPKKVPLPEKPARSSESEAIQTSPLFPREEVDKFRSDWDAIQIAFVDEPRRSVERADELVAQTIQRLAEIFAKERSHLEETWGRGEEVSTEHFRVALQRYRSFFGRLLAA
jgi:hypothetical protein